MYLHTDLLHHGLSRRMETVRSASAGASRRRSRSGAEQRVQDQEDQTRSTAPAGRVITRTEDRADHLQVERADTARHADAEHQRRPGRVVDTGRPMAEAPTTVVLSSRRSRGWGSAR